METKQLRKDNLLIVITHLSQLSFFVLGFGNLLVPLVLWLIQKEKVLYMNSHGKEIINFQITLIVVALLCIPSILLLGLGIIGLLIIGVVMLFTPIYNAIRVSNYKEPVYPFVFHFIK